MGSATQQLKLGLVVAISALALVASDAAVAGYGGGGGGGNSAPKPKVAKPAISAKVKNGDLVMTGNAGSITVNLYPTETGVRLEGRSDTKINGSTDPVFLDGITGDWKLKFPRALAIEFAVVIDDPNAPRPNPVNVKFTGGKRAQFDLRGVDISGDLKVDVRRTLNRRIGLARLEDVTVAGNIKMTGASDRTNLELTDSTVTGATSLKARVRSRSNRYTAGIRLTGSSVNFVTLIVGRGNAELVAQNSTVTSSLDLRGDVDVLLLDSDVAGDVSLRSTFDGQAVRILRSDVTGTVFLATGAQEDEFLLDDCTIGMLEIHSGTGNDELTTTGLTTGVGSLFDGSGGKGDVWQTDGDQAMLDTTRVETVGPIPVQ